jgi:hypothetical protein
MANEQETIYETNIRWERRQARLALIKESRGVKHVRVHPRDDVIRRDIQHPLARRKFLAEGSTEWPLDQFTKRRLRDGTVRLESAEETQARTETRARDRQPRNSTSTTKEPASS